MRIFLTGGTLDKHYNELNGELTFSDTHMQDILACSRLTVAHEVQTLMLKDSLDMTDQDREVIADACLSCSDDQILITHGTDTMVESARSIASALTNANQKKTVVLFGAMLPYEVSNSDALFNFGSAVSAVQLVEPGVYLAMNGKVFDFDDVQKNKSQGLFEPLY